MAPYVYTTQNGFEYSSENKFRRTEKGNYLRNTEVQQTI